MNKAPDKIVVIARRPSAYSYTEHFYYGAKGVVEWREDDMRLFTDVNNFSDFACKSEVWNGWIEDPGVSDILTLVEAPVTRRRLGWEDAFDRIDCAAGRARFKIQKILAVDEVWAGTLAAGRPRGEITFPNAPNEIIQEARRRGIDVLGYTSDTAEHIIRGFFHSLTSGRNHTRMAAENVLN